MRYLQIERFKSKLLFIAIGFSSRLITYLNVCILVFFEISKMVLLK